MTTTPTPRPVPSREDRMRHARLVGDQADIVFGRPVGYASDIDQAERDALTGRQTAPSFATYLDASERDQLDARAATAEQERDDALDDLTKAWAALNRAGISDPIAGIGELIDCLAADRARSATEADQLRDELRAAAGALTGITELRDEALSREANLRTQLNRANTGRQQLAAELATIVERVSTTVDRLHREGLATVHTEELCQALNAPVPAESPVPSRRAQDAHVIRAVWEALCDALVRYGYVERPNLPGLPLVAAFTEALTERGYGVALPHTGETTRPRIVVLCGSTRFRTEIADANRRFTLDGYIVLAPGVFGHDGDQVTDEQKEALDDLHFRKIELADEVYVVNPGGYIGESTRLEMSYARRTGKPVRRLVESSVTLPTYGDDAPGTLRSRP